MEPVPDAVFGRAATSSPSRHPPPRPSLGWARFGLVRPSLAEGEARILGEAVPRDPTRPSGTRLDRNHPSRTRVGPVVGEGSRQAGGTQGGRSRPRRPGPRDRD